MSANSLQSIKVRTARLLQAECRDHMWPHTHIYTGTWNSHCGRMLSLIRSPCPPAVVRKVLEARNAFLQDTPGLIQQLSDPNSCSGVVYAIICLAKSETHNIYIGHTKHTAFKRMQQHGRQAADELLRNASLDPLHLSMVEHGIQQFVTIPLQKVLLPVAPRNNSRRWNKMFAENGRFGEHTWISRLQTHFTQHGLNSRFEVSLLSPCPVGHIDPSHPDKLKRVHGYRDVMRRLVFIGSLQPAPATLSVLKTHLESMSLHTLCTLHQWLTHFTPAALHLSSDACTHVLHTTKQVIKDKTPNRTLPDLSRKLWVPGEIRQLIPHQKLCALLNHTTLKNVIPPGLHFTPPIHYMKGPSLSGKWLSYKSAAQHTLPAADLQSLLSGPCKCNTCHAHLRMPRCDHAIVHDITSLLPDPSSPVAQRLLFFWSAGANYKLHVPVHHTSAVLTHMHANAERYAKQTLGLDNGKAGEWADTLKSLLSAAIIDAQQHPPAHPFFTNVLYDDEVHALFQSITQDFVVTLVDKVSSNFVLVCKKWYFQSLLADLPDPSNGTSENQFYKIISETEMYQNLQDAQDALSPWHFLIDIPDPNAMDTDPPAPHLKRKKPAYYAGLIKLHKSPPQFRFLACSHSTPLSELGLHVTAALRILAPILKDLWVKDFGPDLPPWFIDNCSSGSLVQCGLPTLHPRYAYRSV